MNQTVNRAILHVDMDAFYASVETHDNPRLEGKPVIVGGLGNRGVVATANYPARQFGVHSAMPVSQARRLCPQAIFVRPRMARYQEVSAQIFDIFRGMSPLVEGLSLDEAFLDVTASQRLMGGAEQIGWKLKEQITAATGLTASVGVAHNKFLAKLASDLDKPDGLVRVPVDRVHAFLDPMPIRRLWGIGKQTTPRLKALGILTFGQLRLADPGILKSVLGNRCAHFQALAAGIDDREVVPESPDKSVSHEMTFDQDLTEVDEMLAEILHLAEAVAARLRRRGLIGKTVVVKIRDSSFKTVTRSRSLRAGTNSTRTIYQVARALFDHWRGSHERVAVRLLGVGVTGLDIRLEQDSGDQMDSSGDQRLDQVFDSIIQRYGKQKIVHGLTLRRKRDE